MLHLDPSQKRNVLFTSAGTVSEEIHCPCIAVILCTGDGAKIICGGRRISLGENDVLTVALRSGSVTGTGETVAVFLSPDAETPALPELTVAIPEIIHCGEHRGIKQLAEAIPEAFYGDPAVRDAKLHALAGLLVIRLSEYADTTPDGSTVSACAVYIRSHIDQSLTPGEIAEKLNVPEKKLRSEFAAVYGCTPAEFQRRAKMNHAISLMKESPDMLIKEIAAAVGYRDELWFTKTFGKYTGVSPREYRKRLLLGENAPAQSYRDIYKKGFPVGNVTDGLCIEQKKDGDGTQ